MNVYFQSASLSLIWIGVLSCVFWGQQPKVQTEKMRGEIQKNQLTEISDKKLRETATEIVKKNPETASQLPDDAKIIAERRKDNKTVWRSYEHNEMTQKRAEAYIWTELRMSTLRPDEALTAETWASETARRGSLEVLSTPEEAAIYVDDNEKAVSNSNNFIFPPVGKRRICLRLSGYNDHCEDRDITNGSNNKKIDATLTKQ